MTDKAAVERPTPERLIEILRQSGEAGDLLCGDAADEIARLRLTDAERYAVAAGVRSLEQQLWSDPENLGGEYRDLQRYAATLRGLLERLK